MFSSFKVEVPTKEVIGLPALVNDLNENSTAIINEMNSNLTQWSFPSFTSALQAILIIHAASRDQNLISHRLWCDDYCYLEYGEFISL